MKITDIFVEGTGPAPMIEGTGPSPIKISGNEIPASFEGTGP